MNRMTVVIPSFNCAKWLERAVRSTRRLIGCEVEVIVVDDGSSDETQSVLKSLQDETPLLLSLYKPNGGLSSARNYGLAHASGEYVLFLDADDEVMHCDVSDLTETKCQMIRIGIEEVTTYGHSIKRVEPLGLMSGRDYLSRSFRCGSFYTSSCAYLYQVDWLRTKSLVFEDNLLHEDNLFTVQALLNADSVFVTPTILYRYIRRPDSITTATGDERLLKRISAYGYISSRLTELANEDKLFDLRWKIQEVLDGSQHLATCCSGRKGHIIALYSLLRFILTYKGYGGRAFQFSQLDRLIRYLRCWLFHRKNVVSP